MNAFSKKGRTGHVTSVHIYIITAIDLISDPAFGSIIIEVVSLWFTI